MVSYAAALKKFHRASDRYHYFGNPAEGPIADKYNDAAEQLRKAIQAEAESESKENVIEHGKPQSG